MYGVARSSLGLCARDVCQMRDADVRTRWARGGWSASAERRGDELILTRVVRCVDEHVGEDAFRIVRV